MFSKIGKEIASTKQEVLFRSSRQIINFYSQHGEQIKSQKITSYGEILPEIRALDAAKNAIRKNNGHLEKISLLKPVNMQNGIKVPHRIEVAFQQIVGSPNSHVGNEHDHLRFIGEVENVANTYKPTEDLSTGLAHCVSDFVVSILNIAGQLSQDRSKYSISYLAGGEFNIVSSVDAFNVKGAMDKNRMNMGHSEDIYVFNPKYYSITPIKRA